MEVLGEILVVPFFGQGHLFPCIELCKRLASDHNCKATLIIPSNLSSSVPSSLRGLSLIEIVELPDAPASPPPETITPPLPQPDMIMGRPPGPNPFHKHHHKMGTGLEAYLSERCPEPTRDRPVCAVVDVMMSWSKEFFAKFGIQIVSFFTSGASSAAMQYASWKHHAAEEMKPGDIRRFPGLPQDMELSYSDVQREQPFRRHKHATNNPNNHPFGGPNAKFGRPEPSDRPRWLDEIEGSTGLLFNTCEGLELPFLNYVAAQINKPVYGPSLEEYEELANALEESSRPFIWVIQPNAGRSGPPPGLMAENSSFETKEKGYYPHGLKEKTGDRGLIIRGWAPQLLTLSHPSVGGFLSHCGWNSTVESMGKGVPILAWPIRGDQFQNAKLVVDHLRVGHSLWKHDDDPTQTVKKKSILHGIESLLDDKDVAKEAGELSQRFIIGFPSSSDAGLKSFVQTMAGN
ncbi:OLC1v1031026C1 [Oldenlandia corymbosa var. corymbosa]|uniref:OLC1v1031026C1 n=1 Tax=Oldenlandia corymbosa var. corymbosa TaxID=529605 RepID=A0AAV1CKW2_OLDCO|nr:OLC1v1031026C1 [Oldenlandia corymbosa var. corymbosa]